MESAATGESLPEGTGKSSLGGMREAGPPTDDNHTDGAHVRGPHVPLHGRSVQPFHSTEDSNEVDTGQKGIHWYFEDQLVNALESDLVGKVYSQGKILLTAPASQNGSVAAFRALAKTAYPNESPSTNVVAIVIVLLSDSFSKLSELRKLDLTYAIATAEEAWKMPACANLTLARQLKEEYAGAKDERARKKIAHTKMLSAIPAHSDTPDACRRLPTTLVNVRGEIASHGNP